MASLRNLIVIIVVLDTLQRASCDYPCICNYHVELTVTNSPDDKGTLIGYMYEFDCKPQAFVKDLDSKWLAVAFEKKLGYVQKDEQVQIQKCPGNQPEEDKLPTTTTVTTTPLTTMTQSTVTTPFITTTQSTTTSSTTKTESATTTTPSITFTQSTVHSTTSSVPVTSSVTTTTTTITTTTQQTVTTTPPFTITKSTVPTTPSITNAQPTITTTQASLPTTTLTTTTSTTSPIITKIQSTVPTLTTSATTQPSATTSPSIIAATQQPNTIVQAPHTLLNVSLQTSSCQPDSFQFGRLCYKIVTQPYFWDLAELNCEKSGGHLLSITNANEEEYIFQLLNEFNISEPIWTGLNDKDQEGMFKWSSGDSNFYHNVLTWKHQIKHPYNNDEDCVVLEASKHPPEIDDINCESRHAFICKYQASANTAAPQSSTTLKPNPSGASSASSVKCHARYEGQVQNIDNLCFEYVETKTTWNHARSQCSKSGIGGLAEIRNAKDEEAVTLFLKQLHVEDPAWIGLHDLNMEGIHEWISGTPPGYTNWDSSHNSKIVNHMRTDCAVIKPDGYWKEEVCNQQGEIPHSFLCMYVVYNQPGSILMG